MRAGCSSLDAGRWLPYARSLMLDAGRSSVVFGTWCLALDVWCLVLGGGLFQQEFFYRFDEFADTSAIGIKTVHTVSVGLNCAGKGMIVQQEKRIDSGRHYLRVMPVRL